MAKIEFFALGGLDERGKECYALTINGDTYLLNCGITTPPAIGLGIKKIIPDINWINDNKQNIKGIFVLAPSYERFGALEHFYQNVTNIPIYTTDVGASIITTYFNKRVKRNSPQPVKLNIRILQPLKSEKVGNTQITPFRITNSIPHSVGLIFNTQDGNIVYLDDFIISSNKNSAFEDQLLEINKITNHKNLMLISGTGNVFNGNGFTSPNHKISGFVDSVLFDAPSRTIVACYDDDIYKILSVASTAMNKNRPVCVYSNTLGEVFKYLHDKNIFNQKNFLFINDNELDKSNNAVIIVTGTPSRLFTKLEKILNDDDPKIHVKSDDTFIFVENTVNGFEKLEAEMFDNVAKNDIKHYKIPSSVLPVSASKEDQKYLIEILKPKYIIPISGLYMDFIAYSKAIYQTGFSKQNMIILDNGKCVKITSGELEDKKSFVELEQKFISSVGVLDVGANSMFERDQMKENGAVLLSILFDKQSQTIKRFNYDLVGITNLSESNKVIINQINTECNKQITSLIVEEMKKSKLDIKEIKNVIRKVVDKQYEKKFNKRPLVITTIMFTKNY
ncbi:MAG: ribonuclease J [Mycoplasmataceae bacterium]|jgi:ribonuclease J|nr:ribonuclease J [Mycoplasmataceae bacterium]